MFSNGYLFYNTLTFAGDPFAMAACQSCYNGLERYKDHSAQSACDLCVNDGINIGSGINCGAYPSALDTMTEFLRYHLSLQNSMVCT